MWIPGLYKGVRWWIGHLRRRGAAPEKRVRIAARYARLRPRDPHAWILWGNILVRQAKYQEAERVLRQGLIIHPRSNPDIGWLLARSLTNQSRLREARELLEDQALLFPDSRLPWLGLAEVALREGRWRQAKAFIGDSLMRTPSFDVGGKYEAAGLLSAIPGERAHAIALIKEAMEGGLPNHALPHLLLGALLELEGDADAGQQHLREAETLWDGADGFEDALRNAREILENPDKIRDITAGM